LIWRVSSTRMNPRILIRTPNHLGDCIMAIPMIAETREAYPGSHVTVLTPEHLSPIFYQNPGIDDILPIPKGYVHGLKSVFKIKDIISEQSFDIGYILPPSFGAASAFKLGGVKERIGYIADGRRLLLTRPLPLPVPINADHRSGIYFDLLRRGAGVSLEYVKPKLFLDENDTASGIKILEGHNVGENDRYIIIAFRAVAESRRWGTDNYTALIETILSRYDLKVILIGSKEDADEGNNIIAAIDNDKVINLAGKTSLRELAAICSRSSLFIGNDSGPAHLVAAVGVPIIVISGADDPKETSPLASTKKLLIASYLECISCVKNKCPLKGDEFMRCMKEITQADVLAEVDELLSSDI